MVAHSADDASSSSPTSWFHGERTVELIAIGIVVLAIAGAQWWSKRRRLRFRRLAPMEAIDDAVGRATETGTPVVYITGWGGDMGRPTTMASMAILSHVATYTAEYNSRLLVPSHDPIVASVAEDTIHQAATLAGRPEWIQSSEVTFVTQSQFGYAAAVDGLFARERPGAVFLIGSFEGEALILAEGAQQCGAVTIAGSDSTIQLAFFLVACDYTLIGEELFAAPGLISGDPKVSAAVLAQDWLKYAVLAVLLFGAVGLLAFHADLSALLSR
ncbi:MAG: DUF6754 domain-containing protein [Candidatus Zixiibacteriota bacterium]